MNQVVQTEAASKPERSVINDLAATHGMEKMAFVAALKATVVPANTSDGQFAAFCMVAKQYNLNPLTKEIYAFPSKSGGIQPIVSIDGWCNIINSNPQLDGIQFIDQMTEGKLTAITCKISRKDRAHPIECTEYMSECKRDTDPWKKWPARMLRHKALIQCARYAFSLSGIVDQDEAERMDMVDVTPLVKDASGEMVQAGASPFKSAKQRNEFYVAVEKSYAGCESLEELEMARELNSPKLDAMRTSKNEYDRDAEEQLAVIYAMAEKRVEMQDGELAKAKEGYGSDLGDIPEHMR